MNLQNIVAGVLLVGIGGIESFLAGGPCPLCIGTIATGSFTVARELKNRT